eukprot:14212947-Alexandrium_andersonii.AAC.1
MVAGQPRPRSLLSARFPPSAGRVVRGVRRWMDKGWWQWRGGVGMDVFEHCAGAGSYHVCSRSAGSGDGVRTGSVPEELRTDNADAGDC